LDRDIAAPVTVHAGFSSCDHPSSLHWEDSSLDISRIIKEWREPGSKHYLVETINGLHFKLAFSEISAHWLVTKVSIKFKE